MNECALLHGRYFLFSYSFEPPIDTAVQLAEKNLNWGATHDAWVFSILDATQVLFVYI